MDIKESAFFSPIKSYVLRRGKMTPSQKLSYSSFYEKYCIPFSNSKINLKELFNNERDVIAEIGFGMGDATAEIAQNCPENNYLGFEVHTPGVGKLLGAIDKNGIKNIRIIEYDALTAFNSMLEDASLSGIHLFFPDPWPKKRHHKRRIMQEENITLFTNKLRRGGYLYFITDWEEYATWTKTLLDSNNKLQNKYTEYATTPPWRVKTKFEARAIKEGRSIYELYYIKK